MPATEVDSKKVRPIQMERIVLRKYVSRRLLAPSGAGSGLVRKVEQNLWQSSISSPPTSGSQAASYARWLEFFKLTNYTPQWQDLNWGGEEEGSSLKERRVCCVCVERREVDAPQALVC